MNSGLPVQHDDGPLGRQMLYGLGVIVVIAPLALAVVLAFVLPAIACGCSSPPDLVVVNRTHQAVTVDWQTGGLLGTPLFGAQGSIHADACAVTSWGLATGDVTATVRVGNATRTIRFSVARGSERQPRFVAVEATGSISDALSEMPPGVDATTSCP